MDEPRKAVAEDPTLMRTDRSLLDVESATLVADPFEATTRGSPELDRGSTIGRYVVLEQLGAGGMGVVYAAYDPELDRKIAIKVLQPSSVVDAEVSGGKARLIREAQALARLSHPNVVNVHDVGEEGGRVFVAMEHIDGSTLKQWLNREERGEREILDMFIGAGRGLSAAHAAGLVHRDFKPDNVLVGVDGRPRVVDFGLARGQAGGVDSDSGDSTGTTSSASQLDNELTAAGAVMGTPGYMAPEQHVGGKADAATDQFSFCVALYKALYGERPFAGSSVRALARSVCRGKIRAAPPGSNVPGWLRRVVVRGLAPLAEERHANMDALLVELSRDPRATRRRKVVALGGVLAVGGIGVGAYASGASRSGKACDDAAAAMDSVWNGDRRAAIARAFEASGVAYASDTRQRIDVALDSYAADWTTGAQAACRATHVAQTQSEELLDRRVACLDARREAMDALLEVFVHADARAVERAVSAVHGLPAVGSCADLSALNRGLDPPSSDEMRAEVDALTVALERAAATYRAGRYKDVLQLREALVSRAEAIGYMPTLARAVHELAMAQGELGLPEATETTRRAFRLALEAGHHLVGARAAVDLAHEFGVTRSNPVEGDHWRKVALALARRAGGDSASEIAALNVEAVLAMRNGDDAEAQLLFESMLERLRGQEDSSPNVAVALTNLGAFHAERQEVDEARTYLSQAADLVAAARGPRHPSILSLKSSLATLSAMGGDYAQAREQYEQVLADQRAVYGDVHLDVARSTGGLAVAERHLGNLERAEALYRDSLAQRTSLLGPDHPEIAEVMRNLAMVRADLGFHDEALTLTRDALAMDERVLPATHRAVALGRQEVGRHLLSLGRHAEALPVLEAARDRFAETAAERGRLIETLLAIGTARRGLSQDADALASFERALELSALERDRSSQALAQVGVAWGLRATGGDGARAERLLGEARATELPDIVDQRKLTGALQGYDAAVGAKDAMP